MNIFIRFHTAIAFVLIFFLSFTAVAVAQTSEDKKSESPDFRPPQQETILSYDSNISVAADGNLTVITTIKVWAMGDKIKRGIYRKFPVRYTGRWGERVRVPFDVVSVKRDGEEEPYHIQSEDAYRVLYIGNKDRRLPPNNVYSYEITYKTNRQVGYFEDFDELYWNVNGTEWGFPINKISAVVTLPKKVPQSDLKIDGYTGPKGAKGKDYRSWVDEEERIHFETTKPMPPETGLTIAVGFPKNILTPPSESQQLDWFLSDNAAFIARMIAIFSVLGYYFLAWFMVGRDPARGVVYPRYVPPKFNDRPLSPAGVAYVNRMKKSEACITASMIHFAVGGAMVITETEEKFSRAKSYILEKTGKDLSESFQEHEVKAFQRLFRAKEKVEVKQKNRYFFQSFKKTLFQDLKKEYCGKDKLFHLNKGWFTFGILISVVGILLATVGEFISGDPGAVFVTLFLTVWLSLWTVGLFGLVVKVIDAWKSVFSGAGVLWVVPALMITAFSIPFFIGEFIALGVLIVEGAFFLGATGLLIGVLNYFFFKLLKQPTLEGARVREEIEGLKMYLTAAEEDDLQRSAPEMLGQKDTPEIFEAYLPYAIALGVEVAWTKRFEKVLSNAAVDSRRWLSAHVV